ncbi:AT-rich interactive domain-containing protein 5-like isoform X6 [Vigna angularis]|uniref:AT-rich interactive domain-containing protein 5-like isoform X6 n=1 Tax=Phaseolus angularis TaxID=3914 RepID=UPI0022B38795|nr:AT-rich interactive domain-containing protein 5-like isoform X6 [Vigna angularis]
MKRLRLLQLDHVQLSGDYGYLLPMTEYDEYGTPLDRETFMKELENFYRQRSLEFKPPMFYGEPLNYLKLWRAVIRLGCYDVVFQAIGAFRGFLRPYSLYMASSGPNPPPPL